MLLFFPHIVLFAQLAVAPTIHRADAPSAIPFDTVIAASNFSGVALNLAAGGKVRIVGGSSKLVRVQVTDRGKHCADCIVSVSEMRDGIQVLTGRTHDVSTPADLQIEVEVPTQTNILLTSAGGQVEIEGIDGYVSGTTDFGAVHLFRLSGAVKVETKRGDVTLRQSYVRGSVHTNAGRVLLEDVGGNVQGTSSKGGVIERRVERVSTAQ
jgi:urease beta subunit